MKLLSLLFVLVLSPSIWAQNLNINSLNHKIRNAGADWIAGETSVSRLSETDAKKLLGLGLDPHPDVLFSTPEQMQFGIKAATSLDWRNRNGRNWITSMKNQGACGSCVAFAAVATFETQYRISTNQPSLNIKLSPQFLFSCGGGACQRGWYPETAASFLKSRGVPNESCMPYTSSSGKDTACNRACSNASQISWRIAGYSKPTQSVVNHSAIKAALAGGPLVTTMSVYQDFMNYRGGIYKHVSGKYLGGHAISLIGYDDSKRVFIIKNSWGTGWGEGGFARISYDDTTSIGAWTWKYSVGSSKVFNIESLDSMIEAAQETTDEAPTNSTNTIDESPELVTTLSESQDFVSVSLNTSSDNAFEEVEMHQKYRGQTMRVLKVPMKEAALDIKIKTNQWQNGEWEIFFVGRNKSYPNRDNIESEHYFINVRN